MGRAASNIALECALQTRPNVCLISEEVEAKGLSLKQVQKRVVYLAFASRARALGFCCPWRYWGRHGVGEAVVTFGPQ